MKAVLRVVRHKRGWAVERLEPAPVGGKTVLAVYRTKAEAEQHARKSA